MRAFGGNERHRLERVGVTNAEFRQALIELDLSQVGFARLMHELGDPRDVQTIRRCISNWCRGVWRPSPEIDVILGLLPHAPGLEMAIERARSPER